MVAAASMAAAAAAEANPNRLRCLIVLHHAVHAALHPPLIMMSPPVNIHHSNKPTPTHVKHTHPHCRYRITMRTEMFNHDSAQTVIIKAHSLGQQCSFACLEAGQHVTQRADLNLKSTAPDAIPRPVCGQKISMYALVPGHCCVDSMLYR